MRGISFPLLSVLSLAAAVPAKADTPPAPLSAAEQPAAENAASLYYRGCEFAREGSKQEANDYLRRAADMGHPKAGLSYGVWCFAEHMYLPALLYLTPEAARGQAHALFCLGYLHYKGWGIPKNAPEAYRLFSAAAAQKHPQACTMLAIMALQGEVTGAPDAELAAELLHTAISQVPPGSEDELPDEVLEENADEADEDDDTPEDDATPEDEDEEDDDDLATDILELTDLYIPCPQRILGLMKLRGVGVVENPEHALTLLIHAATNQDTDDTAATTISTLYRLGLGIDPNEQKAQEWELRVADEDRARITPLLNAYLTAEEDEMKLALLGALLKSTARQTEQPAMQQLVEEIMKLPPYTLHENERADFREMLDKGDFRQIEGASFLSISGDGTIGKRTFITTPQHQLYILIENWEEGYCEAMHYDAARQTLRHLFNIKKGLLPE